MLCCTVEYKMIQTKGYVEHNSITIYRALVDKSCLTPPCHMLYCVTDL